MKKHYSLFALMLILFSCGGSTENKVESNPLEKKNWANCKTVAEAKELADYDFTKLVQKYNELCGSVRNDNTMQKFKYFANDVEGLYWTNGGYGIDSDLHNLSYDDQFIVIKYTQSLIDSHSGLKKLILEADIECW